MTDAPCAYAYMPSNVGHYVENVGNTTLRFLEIANTGEWRSSYLATTLIKWISQIASRILVSHR